MSARKETEAGEGGSGTATVGGGAREGAPLIRTHEAQALPLSHTGGVSTQTELRGNKPPKKEPSIREGGSGEVR